ncbi:hypothetical protein HC723_15695 [Vibrio sp. S11_S32]|uniref:hypothetical protein n=1 Tax=Vibrio sp. S11_S32 TaxID=2720225 RepID=UPI00168129E8|nr:hypothetical protein [Vibrio sp. S11_S32]MBD1577841.1 hypothetical protein [Vibrio sp. S11_S32]
MSILTSHTCGSCNKCSALFLDSLDDYLYQFDTGIEIERVLNNVGQPAKSTVTINIGHHAPFLNHDQLKTILDLALNDDPKIAVRERAIFTHNCLRNILLKSKFFLDKPFYLPQSELKKIVIGQRIQWKKRGSPKETSFGIVVEILQRHEILLDKIGRTIVNYNTQQMRTMDEPQKNTCFVAIEERKITDKAKFTAKKNHDVHREQFCTKPPLRCVYPDQIISLESEFVPFKDRAVLPKPNQLEKKKSQ